MTWRSLFQERQLLGAQRHADELRGEIRCFDYSSARLDAVKRMRMSKKERAATFEALERIARSESVPSLEDFLALGRELHDTRLDFFVRGAFSETALPAIYAGVLVNDSCRYHRMADDNARAGIKCLADMLARLAKKPKFYLYVRDELVKFSKLVAEEVTNSNLDAPPQPAEPFDKLTNQQRPMMRFLEGRENKQASIRDAMANAGKTFASKRQQRSFLEAIRRLQDRLSKYYPNRHIDLDRIAHTITLIEQPATE